jgi:hypothetical protein
MSRYAVVFIVALALLLPGCSGSAAKQIAAQQAQYQQDATNLQARITELEAEVKALKEAPQELLRQATDARAKSDFDQASKLLDDVEKKFPATAEAAKVPQERERLKVAVQEKRQADRKAYDDALAKAAAEATPEKAKAVLDDYLGKNSGSAFKADVEKKAAEYAQQIQAAAEEAKRPPVDIVAVNMTQNSIGTPEINLTIRNRSGKTIDGFQFAVDLYDNYDRAVNHYRSSSDGNTYGGISQEAIHPGGQADWVWTLYGFDLATKYKNLRIRSVHFTDGITWEP